MRLWSALNILAVSITAFAAPGSASTSHNTNLGPSAPSLSAADGPASNVGTSPSFEWTAVATIDDTSRGARDVAINTDGDAVVVWARQARGSSSIYAAYRRAGGDWGETDRIGYGTDPQVGLDARGNATVVWSTHPKDWGDAVHATRRLHRSGAWTDAAVLSTPVKEPGRSHAHDSTFPLYDQVGAGRPMLAVNARGDAVVVWHWRADGDDPRDGPGTDFVVQAVHRPLGGRWSDVTAVSDPRPAPGVKSALHAVGMDARGAVTAMWVRYAIREGTADGWIQVRRMKPQGQWTPTATLSRRAYDGADWYEDRDWYIDLAVSERGHAIAVFGRLAVRPAGGTWTRNRPLRLGARRETADAPFLVMDRAGTAYAATYPAGIARKPLGRRVRWQATPDMADVSSLSLDGNDAGDVLLYGQGDNDEGVASYRSRDGVLLEAVVLTEETYWGLLATAVHPRGGAIAVWATQDRQIQISELVPVD